MNIKAFSLLTILFFCFTNGMYAQQALQLSDETPSAGQKLQLSYTIPDSLRASDEELKGAVYYMSKKNFEAFDLKLGTSNGKATATIGVPEDAKGIAFKIALGDWQDKNGGEGYYYMVYEDEKPVAEALAHKALYYSSFGPYVSGIKRDNAKALDLLKQEFAAYPQSRQQYLSRYASVLISNDKNAAQQKLEAMAKEVFAVDTVNESDMLSIYFVFRNQLKEPVKADSLQAIIEERYPDGYFVAESMGKAFSAEKNPVKKAVLYEEYIGKYPEGSDTAYIPDQAYNSMRMQVAQAFANAGNYEKFREYASKIENPSNKARLYNSVAWPLAEKADSLDFAADISKKSLDLVSGIIENPASSKPKYFTESRWKAQNKATYAMYADTYALILSKQGNWEGALGYQRKAIAENENDPDMNERFVMFLMKNGKSAEALEYAESAVERGKSNAKLKEYFKQAYITEKGSEAGWDVYMAGLEKAQKDKIKAKLAKEMINEKAPIFTLTNMDGEKVSLESLKGKVVVVDFWATWCGPCKASFPGMQKAVNKFEDVEFVFVNTWERFDESSKRYEAVEKFIADNEYTFNVLYDTKNESNFDVVTAYGVSGIPTKFVIDKQGNIRFKSVGYMGSPDGELQKVSAMIALAGNEE